ncbi:hypothetical protein FNV43_RR00592 [Rhamnella rubrinervis]|uniref:Disease resistance RPP13-like protein 1 n=1 Tax=Rhamnella rubrinervis TaxID=2594499 RepID=A0A8K0HPF9_9ROSA|nr:hypothetical protein FNV43_RR00592 [Rhamnella rubrinervis]
MAVGEAFLSAFLQVLFDRLASIEFIGLFCGQRYGDLLEQLKITLLTVTALLNDAEEKQFYSPTVEKWLHMAKDAIFDSEDLLDEMATQALKYKLEAESQANSDQVWNWNRVSSSLSPSGRGLDFKLRKIIERLELIAKYKDVLGLKDNIGERSFDGKPRLLATACLVDESCVYGRDGDKEAIIRILLRDEENSNIGVVPIVGMGGIGKTTLAQLVYNDERVDSHFDLKIWACVSYQFDVVKIAKAIVSSVTMKNFDLDNFNLLQVCLKENLIGKRFLLILDDVWNKRNNDWDLLWHPLKAGGRGSKIVVTTRDNDVASSMGTVSPHCLRGLSNEDCWLLLMNQAFENRNMDVCPNLKTIGKEIVKKCEGLPSAVKRLGILLHCRKEEDEWKDILNRKIWDFPEEENDILQTLRLSYHHLPAHLKQCFAFCSVFPVEHQFDKDSLVLLWMAEGLIQQPKGKKRLEEVGDEYFRELVARSFFQESIHNKSLFVMHRLMKELADFVSGEFCFRLEDYIKDNNQKRISEKARHSSYLRGKRDVLARFEALNGTECLRTFLPLDPTGSIGVSFMANNVPYDLLPKLRYLRVLSFNACRISELPDSLGNLKHLRYLDLSHTAIEVLPESTHTLYNLQTLILLECRYLTKLPSKMRNLTNLRHLRISGSRLREMPSQISEMKNLQTLSYFIVGKDSGSGIQELREMTQLQGSLLIAGLQNVVNFIDAMEANLKGKQDLHQLVFQWSNGFADKPQLQDLNMTEYTSTKFPSLGETMDVYTQDMMKLEHKQNSNLDDSRNERVEMLVLEMLQPHHNIKEVAIQDYGGTRFPSWIESPLFSNIKFLRLSNCTKCVYVPALGQLPSLKDLVIEGMERITSIGSEFYGDGYFSALPFPSLETLKFDNMLNWEDWTSYGVEGTEGLLRLQKIEIQNCPKLRKLLHKFSALKKMSIKGCEKLTALPRLSTCHNDIEQDTEYPCLLELSIWGCPNLKELPSLFPSLAILEMDGCQNLTEFPKLPSIRDLELKNFDAGVIQKIDKLTSLTYLRMCEIPKLTHLVEGFFQHMRTLEELRIVNLSELKSLSNMTGLPYLSNLERLEVSECPFLEELPQSFHKLTSLKEFRIWRCPSLVSFPTAGLPPLLSCLEIKDCESLQFLPEGSNSSLEYLTIEGCSSLTSLPTNELSYTLKGLEIHNCINLMSLPNELNNNSLELLRISSCHSIKSFPEGTFSLPTHTSTTAMNLKQLIINNCANLELLPEGLYNLLHLNDLEITGCPLLLSFPEPGLPISMLRSIRLSNCRGLNSLPNHFYSLTSLQELCIDGCSSLVSFPNGGLPANLMSLSVLDCENLKPSFEWGLHRLTCLTSLAFGGCHGLVSFSEEWLLPTSLFSLQLQRLPNLKTLPKGLKYLTSLDNLEIWECDSLQTLPEEETYRMVQNFDFWDVL